MYVILLDKQQDKDGLINKFGDLEFKLFNSQFKNKFYPKCLIYTAL